MDVNLLPRRSRREVVGWYWVGLAAFCCLLLLAAGVWRYHHYWEQFENKQAALAQAVQKEKSLESRLGQVQDLLAEWEWRQTLQQLESKRALISEVFVPLRQLLPEGSRLTRISMDNGEIKLEGQATSVSGVRDYINALTRSGLFSGIWLDSIQTKQGSVLFAIHIPVHG